MVNEHRLKMEAGNINHYEPQGNMKKAKWGPVEITNATTKQNDSKLKLQLLNLSKSDGKIK